MSVKLGFVGLFLFQNVVDSCKQRSGNGNDGFFVTSALFQCTVTVVDFRMFVFTLNSNQSSLNQQGLNVYAGTADASGFLLSRALIVLRSKTSPRTKMLGCWEY